MTLTHAMWVHGHSTQIEYLDRTSSIERKGYYIRVTGKNDDAINWFHFPIPTPVIIDNKRLKVGSVLIRFRTSGSTYTSVVLYAIHIYDGEKKIAVHNGLKLEPHRWHVERFNVLGQPEIKWGLGISIGVKFVAEKGIHFPKPGYVDFSSAGCDFL